MTFEQTLQRLEEIVRDLERTDLDLDRALAERAIGPQQAGDDRPALHALMPGGFRIVRRRIERRGEDQRTGKARARCGAERDSDR